MSKTQEVNMVFSDEFIQIFKRLKKKDPKLKVMVERQKQKKEVKEDGGKTDNEASPDRNETN